MQIDSVIAELLDEYFNTVTDIRPVAGGYNNTTRYVTDGNDRYVLRIYDNHGQELHVRYEMELLGQLERQGLSFQVPSPVLNRAGQQLTRTANGKLAVLFRHIPGNRPVDADARQVGRAAGELSAAMDKVRIAAKPPYQGHNFLYEIHPAVDRESLHRFLEQPADGWGRDELDRLKSELRHMESVAEQFAGLPEQMIHGDLWYGNVLAKDGQVTGILDFEFASPDMRAMEVAICLAEFLEGNGLSSYAQSFLSGFGETRKLSREEVRAMPGLLRLRYLVSFLHHFGRWRSGVDAEEPAKERLTELVETADWLESSGGRQTVLEMGEAWLL